jgi:hypothetical protein
MTQRETLSIEKAVVIECGVLMTLTVEDSRIPALEQVRRHHIGQRV